MDDRMVLYIGPDGRTLTDWEGTPRGFIELPITKRRHNGWISHERWWFRARIGGQTYACQGFGPGVYCKCRRIKGR